MKRLVSNIALFSLLGLSRMAFAADPLPVENKRPEDMPQWEWEQKVRAGDYGIFDFEEAATEMGQKVQNAVKNMKIPFVDPKTGLSIEADDYIYIEGLKKQVVAGDYLGELQKMEGRLNEFGLSFATIGELATDPKATVTKLKKNAEDLLKQQVKDEGDHMGIDPLIMEAVLDPSKAKEKLQRLAEDEAKKQLNELYRLAQESGIPLPSISSSAPDPKIVELSRENLSSTTTKSWIMKKGQESSFLVELDSVLDISSGMLQVLGTAKANAQLTVLSKKKFDLISGLAQAQSDATQGGLKNFAQVQIQVLGEDILKRQWEKDISISGKDLNMAFAKVVRYGQKYRFAIGPIPMSAEIGVLGEAGFDWVLSVANLRGGMSLVAQANLAAFANCAADIEIVTAGVESNLVVFEDLLRIEGSAGLEDNGQGSPEMVTSLKASNNLKALQGKVFFFVSAYVPDPEPSFLKKKTWNWELFNWPGINLQNQALYNFTRKQNKSGFRLDGAPRQEDYKDVEVTNALKQTFDRFVGHLASPAHTELAARANELSGKSQIIRGEISNWLESLKKTCEDAKHEGLNHSCS